MAKKNTTNPRAKTTTKSTTTTTNPRAKTTTKPATTTTTVTGGNGVGGGLGTGAVNITGIETTKKPATTTTKPATTTTKPATTTTKPTTTTTKPATTTTTVTGGNGVGGGLGTGAVNITGKPTTTTTKPATTTTQAATTSTVTGGNGVGGGLGTGAVNVTGKPAAQSASSTNPSSGTNKTSTTTVTGGNGVGGGLGTGAVQVNDSGASAAQAAAEKAQQDGQNRAYTGMTSPSDQAALAAIKAQNDGKNRDYSGMTSPTDAAATGQAGTTETGENTSGQASATSTSSAGTSTTGAVVATDTTPLDNPNQQANTMTSVTVDNAPQVNTPELQKAPDAPDMQAYLDAWLAAGSEQAKNQIDYATQQGITELQRAEEDAQSQFQQLQDEAVLAGAKALDNQALYAETRGDRGGIGATQYALVQNGIAQNQQAIRQQQVKLSTDTARQISDLRAKGEFEKADALLSLTQNYLSQLMSLKQWAANYALNQVEFDNNIAKYMAEYEMKLADITGVYQGQLTQAAMNNQADMGFALLKLGIMPSAQQLASMGISRDQAQQNLLLQGLGGAATGYPGGGSVSGRNSGNGGGNSDNDVLNLQKQLNALGAGLVEDGIMGPKTRAAMEKYGLGTNNYNFGELVDAFAGGMTKAQVESVLASRGVNINDALVQADIQKAMSK